MSYQSERQLLGTILKHGATPAAQNAIEALSEKHFTEQVHRVVFVTIRQLSHHAMPINLGMILDKAAEYYELAAELIHEATAEKAIERLAKSIKASYSAKLAERMLLKAVEQVQKDPQGYEKALLTLEANLQTLEGSEDDSEPLKLEAYAKGYVELMEARVSGDINACGLDIGLDMPINRTDLIVLGGSPGINFYQVPFAA